MNFKLIMLPNPILVSDLRISVGDSYHTSDYRIVKWLQELEDFSEGASSYPKPIIAGIEGLPKLDLSAIAEKIGWVDVEKLADDCFNKMKELNPKGGLKEFIRMAVMYGYNAKAAQSLNEKKWVDNDMIDFHNFIFNHPNQFLKMGEYLEEFKKSRKPKEYKVECIQEGNIIKVTKIINQI